MYTPSDRATDERDLRALDMVRRGVDRKIIAAVTGMTRPYIGAVLGRVKSADVAESGEPAERVIPAYLPPVKTRATAAKPKKAKFRWGL